MLLPFFPLNPHRFVATSLEVSPSGSVAEDLRSRRVPGPGGTSWIRLGLPPRMADTDECGERACFWRAEEMAMHSDMTRDTGSTATDTGRLRYCMREEVAKVRRGGGVPGLAGRTGSIGGACWTSRLMLERDKRCLAARANYPRGPSDL
jgi:hypothetical protein